MSSIETLKQELINQKQLLESKGFDVPTAHTYPSPTEITSAIDAIDIDFSPATAKPEDVASGKTFFGNTPELQTGTLNRDEAVIFENYIKALICAKGEMEIYIPTDETYTKIRPYAYYTPEPKQVSFYKHDLLIPSNIKDIGNNAFNYCDITGKLTISSACTGIHRYCFQRTQIEEVEIFNGLVADSSYAFYQCTKLKKAIMHSPISYIGSNCFYYCTAMEEIYFPETLTATDGSIIGNCKSLTRVQFSSETPMNISTSFFTSCRTANILVPYKNYYAYLTATNYQVYDNIMYGYGSFAQNATLPNISEDGGYNITWYPTYEDLIASTNPITSYIAPFDSEIYASFSAIDSGSTT